jgi:hypothetical protein
MSAETDAACPVNTREDIATRLDKGEDQVAKKLWESCTSALVDNSPEFKALADRTQEVARKEQETGKVSFADRMRLGIQESRLSDILFPRAVEMMNQIKALQQPKPKCYLYESHWKESINGGPLEEKEDVNISCMSAEELRGRFRLPPTRPDYGPPPVMPKPKHASPDELERKPGV